MGFAKKQSPGCPFRFEQLEDRRLLAATVELPHLDESCTAPETVCYFATQISATTGSETPVTVDSFSDDPVSTSGTLLDGIFQLQSYPTAQHTIYLDFTGFTTVNTLWNAQYAGRIDTPAFSLDDDYDSFSDLELAAIHWIWACVSEDFAPFNVNVTTKEPEAGDLVKSGSSDDRWGIRVVIGGTSDWYGQPAGGLAYTGTFNDPTDTPCFVFAEEFLKNTVTMDVLTNIASAISHEVGHTLGLSHDGHQSGIEYYNGHVVPDTHPPITWGSIMGAGYDKSIVQWSQGEYSGADNTENDLAVITTQNGFGYRADDHASDRLGAIALTVTGTSFEVDGIIERNTDEDYFIFRTTGGTAKFLVEPTRYDGNLDAKLELLDGMGNVIAVSTETAENPFAASISVPLEPGIYFVRVSGCGKGDALTGYSDYGSLGQYTLSATGVYSEDFPPPRIETFDFPAEYQTEKWILRQTGNDLVIVDDRENVVYRQTIDSLDGLTLRGGNSGAIVLCIDLSGGTPDLAQGIVFEGTPDALNRLEILGTDQDDDFLIESSQGTFNGVTVSWTNVSFIHIDTLEGSDRLEMRSADDDAFLRLRDGKLAFHATTVETVEAVHVENMLVSVIGKSCSARIDDTPGNDAFYLAGDSVTLQTDRQMLQAVGFEIAELVAIAGGKDTALIRADDGAMIVMSDLTAEYRNQDRFYRVWYTKTVATVNPPENDALLIHYGSQGTDLWEQSEEMVVAGNTIGSYDHRIIGFPQFRDENVEPPEPEPASISFQESFGAALMRFLAEEYDLLKKRRTFQPDDFSINFDDQTLLDLVMR